MLKEDKKKKKTGENERKSIVKNSKKVEYSKKYGKQEEKGLTVVIEADIMRAG